MIDKYTNLLEKKYGKLITGAKELPHEKHCNTCVLQNDCPESNDLTDSCDDWKSIDKEELIIRILILEHNLKLHFDELDSRMLRNLYSIGTSYHNLKLYDMYVANEDFEVCEDCFGSGYNIGATGVTRCSKCSGEGFIKKSHKDKKVFSLCQYNSIFAQPQFSPKINYYYESIIDRISDRSSFQLLSPFKRIGCVTILAYLDTKYLTQDGDDWKLAEDRKYVVFSESDKCIITTGDYEYIHRELKLPYYIDIEDVSNHELSVMEESEFRDTYKISKRFNEDMIELDSSLYDSMRDEIFSSNMLLYIESATYDCRETIKIYNEKYTRLESILENVVSHINVEENMFVKEEDVKLVNKIVMDAKILGLELMQIQAAKLLELTMSIAGENIKSSFNYYNALVIFVVEYICITEYIISED